nr:linoleate 13S-lipoxygenase 3-1, chloroplastic-like [Tanacetum cinerariifolium]
MPLLGFNILGNQFSYESDTRSTRPGTHPSDLETTLTQPAPFTRPATHPIQEDFKVRGVFTVRNKVHEDFKETLVRKIDTFTDQLIGRNVVLELFSLDVDPSVGLKTIRQGKEERTVVDGQTKVKAEFTRILDAQQKRFDELEATLKKRLDKMVK